MLTSCSTGAYFMPCTIAAHQCLHFSKKIEFSHFFSLEGFHFHGFRLPMDVSIHGYIGSLGFIPNTFIPIQNNSVRDNFGTKTPKNQLLSVKLLPKIIF